jgi:hypothetical protein
MHHPERVISTWATRHSTDGKDVSMFWSAPGQELHGYLDDRG